MRTLVRTHGHQVRTRVRTFEKPVRTGMSDKKGISRRAFAKLVGLKSDNSVRKAIEAGRIPVLADGTIDPEAAIPAWKSWTNATQQRRITEHTDASDPDAAPAPIPSAPPPKPAADTKVLQFPGAGTRPDTDTAARLAEHQRKNLEKGQKAVTAQDEGQPQDATTAAINKRIMQEKLRRLQNENDLAERLMIERGPVLMLMETLARDTREGWQQFVDKFAPSITEALGLSGREHDVFVVLKDAVDQHLLETISKIEADRYFARLES